jgi:hypothetical protein
LPHNGLHECYDLLLPHVTTLQKVNLRQQYQTSTNYKVFKHVLNLVLHGELDACRQASAVCSSIQQSTTLLLAATCTSRRAPALIYHKHHFVVKKQQKRRTCPSAMSSGFGVNSSTQPQYY